MYFSGEEDGSLLAAVEAMVDLKVRIVNVEILSTGIHTFLVVLVWRKYLTVKKTFSQ